jgi:hypothetical protein
VQTHTAGVVCCKLLESCHRSLLLSTPGLPVGLYTVLSQCKFPEITPHPGRRSPEQSNGVSLHPTSDSEILSYTTLSRPKGIRFPECLFDAPSRSAPLPQRSRREQKSNCILNVNLSNKKGRGLDPRKIIQELNSIAFPFPKFKAEQSLYSCY